MFRLYNKITKNQKRKTKNHNSKLKTVFNMGYRESGVKGGKIGLQELEAQLTMKRRERKDKIKRFKVLSCGFDF